MPKSFKYKAFTSYSHHDKKAVDWLHKKLETYRIPRSLVGKKTQSGEIQKRLYPIFRDREELPTANELASVIKCTGRIVPFNRYLLSKFCQIKMG